MLKLPAPDVGALAGGVPWNFRLRRCLGLRGSDIKGRQDLNQRSKVLRQGGEGLRLKDGGVAGCSSVADRAMLAWPRKL